MNIAFLNHGYLVQRECLAALHRRSDVSLCVINTEPFPSEAQADATCAELEKRDIHALLTINDWGMDIRGAIAAFLDRRNRVHANWCTDDPFFVGIMLGTTPAPHAGRIDFVTDRSYLPPLHQQGFTPLFLPLAADPHLFSPASPPLPFARSCAFVGNSYFEDLFGKYAKGHEDYLEAATPLISHQARCCITAMTHNPEPALLDYCTATPPPPELSFNKAVFLLLHAVGYFVRKELVTGLAGRHADCIVFGDAYWASYLPAAQVSMGVAYYDNLSATYQQTRVNIDINRMVIRQGFTQRVMDCLACCAFVLTSEKTVVNEFFTTGTSGHLDVYRCRDELYHKVDWYLAHEEVRKKIAARGRELILTAHTYRHRIETILQKCRTLLSGRK